MSKKNYNAMALRGIAVDDMEFVKQFGLDPALAYTPELNNTLLNRMYDLNVSSLQSESGLAEKDARREAGRMRANAKREIEGLLK